MGLQLQEQVGSEDEMDLAYLRKERKLKCLKCCGHVESDLGDFEKSRNVTAGYWRDMESYPKSSGDPFNGFKPENSKICFWFF